MRFGYFFVACGLALSACAQPPARAPGARYHDQRGNSGLLETLLPAFERQHGPAVRSHLVGSGLALQMLERGDVDVVISQQCRPRKPRRFPPTQRGATRRSCSTTSCWSGRRPTRRAVRAGLDFRDAMRRIARSTARFLSRGDQSGTHEREEALWQSAPPARRRPAGRGGRGDGRHAAHRQ